MTVLTQNAQTHAGAESCRPQQRRIRPPESPAPAGAGRRCGRLVDPSREAAPPTVRGRCSSQQQLAGASMAAGGAIHSGATCTATARSSHSTEQPSLGTNRRREAPRLLPAPASPRPSGSPGRRRALERPAGQSSDNGLNPQPRRAELSFFLRGQTAPLADLIRPQPRVSANCWDALPARQTTTDRAATGHAETEHAPAMPAHAKAVCSWPCRRKGSATGARAPS